MSRFIFIVSVLLLLGCTPSNKNASQPENRKPNGADSSTIDLLKETDKILIDLDSEQTFSIHSCPAYLSNLYMSALDLDPKRFHQDQIKKDWMKVYQQLWLTRVKLHKRLQEFTNQTIQNNPTGYAQDKTLLRCVDNARNAFRLARYVEDYLAEYLGHQPQDIDLPENQKPQIPTPFENSEPWTVINPLFKQVTLKSGDLIISRGNAYSSAAIARIVEIDSQFSHLAMIYFPSGSQKEITIQEAMKSKDVLVLEAHIEIGSTIRSFADYAKDGNARNLLFRFPDAVLAHQAAKKSHDYLESYRKKARRADRQRMPESDVNYSVPYDFKMILSKANEVFCTEVGYYGFNEVGIQIPTFQSQINPKLDLVKRLGIEGTQIFAPGDLELDHRFQMIAEFRNLKKLKGLRMKDMALTSLLTWMDSGYVFAPIPPSVFRSTVAWISRQLDFKFVKNKLPKNMNTKVLNTIFTLDNVASRLEKKLIKKDKEYKAVNQGLLMTFSTGLKHLESIRLQDRQLYLDGKAPLFHWEFRPAGLQPKTPNN